MNAEAIFLPMLATMVLTAIVWFVLYARRIPAMRRARVSVQTYTTPDAATEHLPEFANYPAFNLRNLTEVPVLYYALCLYLFVTGNVDSTYVALAWVFFALRTLHSVVHCTVNRVMWRFYLYAASSLALWIMLGRAMLGVFAS